MQRTTRVATRTKRIALHPFPTPFEHKPPRFKRKRPLAGVAPGQWLVINFISNKHCEKHYFFCENHAEEIVFSPCGYCKATKMAPVAGLGWKLVPVANLADGSLTLGLTTKVQRTTHVAIHTKCIALHPFPTPTSTRFILKALLGRPEEMVFHQPIAADEKPYSAGLLAMI